MSELLNSYKRVFQQFLNESEFDNDKIKDSRNLFFQDNLSGMFIPKNFEVRALVSGLPFSSILCKKILNLQNSLSKFLPPDSFYWVKEKNLGVEYFVSKWPEGKFLNEEQEFLLRDYIKEIKPKKFNLTLDGFQIHSDGCVVIRGFDNDNIRDLRGSVLKNFEFIPRKQSNWCHIPIGRILTPLNNPEYEKLKKFSLNQDFIYEESISSIKYVHEHQWYMEKKDILWRLDL